MGVATGPMRALPALDVPPAAPSFTPRVPDKTDPYSAPARDVAVAAALTRQKLAPAGDLPRLPRRTSSRPLAPRAQAPDWDSLVRLRGALVAWNPGNRPLAPARGGESIFAAVLAGPAVAQEPPAVPVLPGPAMLPDGTPAASVDPIDDGGAFRDEVAGAYRALAVKSGGIPDWCPDCTPARPCKVHVVLGRRARRAWHLADRLASCATSWDAALLLVSEGGRIASE